MQYAEKNSKYIILVRHGEPDNPKKIVYNLDEVMGKGNEIRITKYGKKQLRALGKVITKKGFKIVRILHSNQTRAVESAKSLNEILKVKGFQEEKRLSDVYAPGGYLEGMKMAELRQRPGDAYSPRWKKYNHETPPQIYTRFNQVFLDVVNTLDLGETAILVSHGDPIAWFVNYKIAGKFPDPEKLRNLTYPNQGQGIVLALNAQNKVLKYYFLQDPELLSGK